MFYFEPFRSFVRDGRCTARVAWSSGTFLCLKPATQVVEVAPWKFPVCEECSQSLDEVTIIGEEITEQPVVSLAQLGALQPNSKLDVAIAFRYLPALLAIAIRLRELPALNDEKLEAIMELFED